MIDETLVHHIDTARFLFGDVLSIYAEAARRNDRIAGEDHAILTVRHANQVIGGLTATAFSIRRSAAPASIRPSSMESRDQSRSLDWVKSGVGMKRSGAMTLRVDIVETASTLRRSTF